MTPVDVGRNRHCCSDFRQATEVHPRRGDTRRPAAAAVDRSALSALPRTSPLRKAQSGRLFRLGRRDGPAAAGVDTDIPTRLEGYLISSTATCYVDHTLRKAAFMFCQVRSSSIAEEEGARPMKGMDGEVDGEVDGRLTGG